MHDEREFTGDFEPEIRFWNCQKRKLDRHYFSPTNKYASVTSNECKRY